MRYTVGLYDTRNGNVYAHDFESTMGDSYVQRQWTERMEKNCDCVKSEIMYYGGNENLAIKHAEHGNYIRVTFLYNEDTRELLICDLSILQQSIRRVEEKETFDEWIRDRQWERSLNAVR